MAACKRGGYVVVGCIWKRAQEEAVLVQENRGALFTSDQNARRVPGAGVSNNFQLPVDGNAGSCHVLATKTAPRSISPNPDRIAAGFDAFIFWAAKQIFNMQETRAAGTPCPETSATRMVRR